MAIINNDLTLSSIVEKNRFDSEYFQPEFVENERCIRKVSSGYRKIGSIAYITDGDHSVRKYTSEGVPFLTSENFSEFTINHETNRYITPKYELSLKRSRAEKEAVYITKTGRYYGKAAICLDDEPVFNIPADVGKIKLLNSEVSPYFLVGYLNSKYGYTAIRRENSGGTRDRITLVNLRNIEIPLLKDDHIEETIVTYINRLQISKTLYDQAIGLLSTELNLSSIIRKNKTFSETSFSTVTKSHRLDSQHFREEYKELIEHLGDFNSTLIKNIRFCNRRGVQPQYVNNGVIDVVNSQHIGKKHLLYDSFQKTSESFYNKSLEGQILENDLLIYTTGAYIGQTNIYLKSTPALASNHVNILRIKPGIDPAYLTLVLQSKIGTLQTEMHLRGSAQAELYPSDIDKFLVPIIDISKQQKIGDLLRESLKAENSAKKLKIQIKSMVDKLIEGGAGE